MPPTPEQRRSAITERADRQSIEHRTKEPSMTPDRRISPPAPDSEEAAHRILTALRGLRFGSVEITVHEGRIVQIERREKLRLNVSCPGGMDAPGAGD